MASRGIFSFIIIALSLCVWLWMRNAELQRCQKQTGQYHAAATAGSVKRKWKKRCPDQPEYYISHARYDSTQPEELRELSSLLKRRHVQGHTRKYTYAHMLYSYRQLQKPLPVCGPCEGREKLNKLVQQQTEP